MKNNLVLTILICFSLPGFSQISNNARVIVINEISNNYLNHIVPCLFLSNDKSFICKSNVDSLCLITDSGSFIKILDFVVKKKSNNIRDVNRKYKYGAIEVEVRYNENKSLNYIIEEKSETRLFLKQMQQTVIDNKLDTLLIPAITEITPKNTQSAIGLSEDSPQ